MTAQTHNFSFHEGEADSVPVTVTKPDGTALNLTGLTVHYRAKAKDGSTVLDLTDGSGITVTDAAAGKLEILFTATDTSQQPGAYRHELRLEGIDYAETVFVGELRINESIFV